MPSYSALPKQEMREKNLIQNSEFMSDIGQFLAKRNNEVFDSDHSKCPHSLVDHPDQTII